MPTVTTTVTKQDHAVCGVLLQRLTLVWVEEIFSSSAADVSVGGGDILGLMLVWVEGIFSTSAADVSMGGGDILELLLSLIKQWWLLFFHPVPFSVIFVQRTCLASPGKEVLLYLHTRVCLSST